VEVTFTTSADDVVEHLARSFWKDRNARTYFLAIWLLIPLGTFVASGVLVARGSQKLVAVLLPLIGVAHLVATPLVFWRRFRRSARQTAESLPNGLLGPTTLILTDAGLTHITEASRVEIPWGDVEEVEDRDELITISLGGTLPFLVPRRGFAEPAQYHALREHLFARVGMLR
jgi:hypothetical protein